MSDRGQTIISRIDVDEEHRAAVLAVLASHFSSYGIDTLITEQDGSYSSDEWIDNQDNYGNAESLLESLIEAGASKNNFSLQLYDGVYVFRAMDGAKRVDVANDDGEHYVTQRTITAWLDEGISLSVLRERLDEHFGVHWP